MDNRLSDNQQTIEVLNTLITINNDRIEGYETASEETEEHDLKELFSKFKTTSQNCNNALNAEVLRLGGSPAEGTLISGKFFRVWMDVKAALTDKEREYILNSCEYGEDAAKGTYEKVLEENLASLSIDQQMMIKAQHALLKDDHDTIKYMRDVLVNEK